MAMMDVIEVLLKRIPITALIIYTLLKWRYVLLTLLVCFGAYLILKNAFYYLTSKTSLPLSCVWVLVLLDVLNSMKSFADLFCVDLSYIRAICNLVGYRKTCPDTSQRVERLPNDVGLYVYTPAVKKSRKCILFIHGGEWCFFSAFAYNPTLSWMTHYLEMTICSVEYKLAPEHPFPEPLLDCYNALQWIYDNQENLGIDEDKIFVAGDSAGGNLAAGLCLLHSDRKGAPLGDEENHHKPIKGQVLLYPMLQGFYCGDRSNNVLRAFTQYALGNNKLGKMFRCQKDFEEVPRFWGIVNNIIVDKEIASYRSLEKEKGEKAIRNGYIFPLHNSDLTGIPPTLTIVASADDVKHDGIFLDKYLKSFKIESTLKEVNNVHGFMLTSSSNTKEVVMKVKAWIQELQ